MNFAASHLIFPTTPEVCRCITLGTKKFEFAANLGENANKMHFTCIHFIAFRLISYILLTCLLLLYIKYSLKIAEYFM